MKALLNFFAGLVLVLVVVGGALALWLYFTFCGAAHPHGLC